MILRGVLKAAAAGAALATAVAATLIAAGFALYAVIEPQLGRPGAAAVVALVFALVAVIIALVLSRKPNPHRAGAQPEDQGMAERVLETARSRPLLTAAAAAAAGFIAWRNPALVGLIATALLKRPDDRRR